MIFVVIMGGVAVGGAVLGVVAGVPLVKTIRRLDRLSEYLEPRVTRVAVVAEDLIATANQLVQDADEPVVKLLAAATTIAADVKTICDTLQLVGVRKRLSEIGDDIDDGFSEIAADVGEGISNLTHGMTHGVEKASGFSSFFRRRPSKAFDHSPMPSPPVVGSG